MSLAIAGGRYYAHTGCRRLEGRYELEGEDGVHFEPGSLDAPPCEDPDVAQQEREFISILEIIQTWEIEGERLELDGPNHEGMILFHAP